MRAIKLHFLLVISTLALISNTAFARNAVLEDDIDFEEEVVHNKRAAAGVAQQQASLIKPSKVETHKLMHKFSDQPTWEERGIIEVSKDSAGKVLQVKVDNNPLSGASSTK